MSHALSRAGIVVPVDAVPVDAVPVDAVPVDACTSRAGIVVPVDAVDFVDFADVVVAVVIELELAANTTVKQISNIFASLQFTKTKLGFHISNLNNSRKKFFRTSD